MNNEEAIKTIMTHVEHWHRLLRDKICDETEGKETIEAFLMAIEALEQTQWIPCSERLPRKDEPVFVYLFGDSPYLAWWDGRDWETEDFTVDRSEEPIAWLPLPKAYEGKTK